MRRIVTAVVLMIALTWTVVSLGIEANGAPPVVPRLYAASGTGTIQYVFAVGEYPPSGFTLYSADASKFWFRRRFADGVNDTIPLPVPSGRSFLIPPPSAIAERDSMTMTIWVGGATDTVLAVPYYR